MSSNPEQCQASLRLGWPLLSLLLAALTACGGGGGGGSSSPSTYTVGGSVSGLTGSDLVLENNGTNALTLSANGPFTFTAALNTETAYAVTVASQPTNPSQTCMVSDAEGTIVSADVTNVSVICTTQAIAAAAPNVVAVVVDSGPPALPANDIDLDTPFVTVTICAPPGMINCQIIDHVEIDTASYGLRIMSSVLSASLYAALPQVNESSSGQPLAECAVFADGYSWGSIKSADLQISGESVSGLEVQIIGDPNYPTVPGDCASTGPQMDTVDTFGANGILGVGPFPQDCGTYCTTGPQSANYYICHSSSSCTDSTVSLAQQVMNPVVLFPADYNGTIVELPPVPTAGAATLTGALVFGIGTEGNNGVGNATVLTIDTTYGELTTNFNGQSLTQSFFDTGSNGFLVDDSSIPQCPGGSGFYCPSTTLNLSATNVGVNDANSTVSFSIANAEDLNASYYVFNDLGGTGISSSSFDWGLPFFLGLNVYTAIDGQNTSAGAGPYFAY